MLTRSACRGPLRSIDQGRRRNAIPASLVFAFILGLFVGALPNTALAEEIWDPPWLEDPTDPQWSGGVATYQRWEFDENPDIPVEFHNPFGEPFVELGGASYPDPVIGPDGQTIIDTWHIDEDGGFLQIYVPNDPTPRERKVIFLQITSDTGALLGSPISDPPGTVSYPKGAIKHDDTGWYTYTAQIEIPFNPPQELVTYRFPASTNISEVVVDTICVPEPAGFALLAMAGLGGLLFRRHSQRDAV